ncbi:MAG: 50S ribosomal protein L4 [Candidatus Nanoarchaeia archaeon]|nr:50S ribosomal protein L4 [Candidatus Nanoarchaeia archaeon]
MKAEVLDINGKKIKSMDLPIQFSEEYRPDLIKRAVLALFSHGRQKYGAFARAGKQQSVKLSRRRHDYKGAYGIGISRAPRKTMWRRGTQFGWAGSFAPYSVGGRRAHPPKPEKNWDQKINVQERRKAIRSAIAATGLKELHPSYEVPFIIENKFESLNKTKDVETTFKNLNLYQEIERCKEKKVRSGVGKLRGRKYKRKMGPLIVVSKDCNLINSAENIAGINVVKVENLNASILTKGVEFGRLVLYTEGAIEKLKDENLFTNDVKRPQVEIKKPEVKEVKKVVKKEIKKEKTSEAKKEVKKKVEKKVSKK